MLFIVINNNNNESKLYLLILFTYIYIHGFLMFQTTVCLGVTAGGLGAVIFALDNSVKASELIVHPPHYHWSFNGLFQALDHSRYF